MKKIILSTFLLAGCYLLKAQSSGEKFLYQERYLSAVNSFRDYLKTNPEDARAWYGLTRASVLQNKVMVAGQGLYSAPATIHQEPYFLVSMGTILLHLGNVDSANYYFKEALNKTKSRDADILAAIAQAYINSPNGDANYAIELINKAIKRDKKNPALYILLGDAYKKLSNGSGAFTAYRQAFELDPSSAAAYYKTGEIFLGQKNTDLFLEYFNKAIQADATYGPAYYRLYAHYFFHDPVKALQFFNQYAANADLTTQSQYELADLYYLNRQYETAISKAGQLMREEGNSAKPRLYKLLGYSYAGLGDTAKAVGFMQDYLSREADSNVIAKDFETLAELYTAIGRDSLALVSYASAVNKEKDPERLYGYYKKLADLAKDRKDYITQAKWLQAYYTGNQSATNLDLFNWALAHFRAGEYQLADSVFGMYTAKYPEQSFGYYWRARSNVARDTDVVNGLAVPHYEKLIEVLEKDTANENYKKWMVEAYAYLAAYEANARKDYQEAVDYFEKVLEVDPANEDAKKYIAILERNITERPK